MGLTEERVMYYLLNILVFGIVFFALIKFFLRKIRFADSISFDSINEIKQYYFRAVQLLKNAKLLIWIPLVQLAMRRIIFLFTTLKFMSSNNFEYKDKIIDIEIHIEMLTHWIKHSIQRTFLTLDNGFTLGGPENAFFLLTTILLIFSFPILERKFKNLFHNHTKEIKLIRKIVNYCVAYYVLLALLFLLFSTKILVFPNSPSLALESFSKIIIVIPSFFPIITFSFFEGVLLFYAFSKITNRKSTIYDLINDSISVFIPILIVNCIVTITPHIYTFGISNYLVTFPTDKPILGILSLGLMKFFVSFVYQIFILSFIFSPFVLVIQKSSFLDLMKNCLEFLRKNGKQTVSIVFSGVVLLFAFNYCKNVILTVFENEIVSFIVSTGLAVVGVYITVIFYIALFTFINDKYKGKNNNTIQEII
jgi:hypothetical protein